ncbi:VOC family protein [Membranihabitans maritimus]|uniref:VOC family protein n=1 Tax=Membranihabitans maritimus TaxID=2904244 RepID=UPI001F3CA501|nr:VOC family protein [Membranihabitans maritimus]
MKIEHFAINVPEPQAMADWYVRNLGMNIVKQMHDAPFMTFLADNSGKVMLEIYRNDKAPVPNYTDQHPLVVHLAFVSEDPGKDKIRLLEAGAKEVSDDILSDGSHLVMLKDPWGISVQLCKRSSPMI